MTTQKGFHIAGWRTAFLTLLLCTSAGQKCSGQNRISGVCAVFAEGGALATGTLRNGMLEIKLDEHGVAVGTIQVAIPGLPFGGLTQRCEEAFSSDGKWLATVVPSSDLKVVILDRKSKSVHRSFSSTWHQFNGDPIEPMYRSSFLGGFLQDNSLVLWRYVPRVGPVISDASHADLHMQRWSVEGELISDENLGSVGFGPGGRQPVALRGFNLLWIPGECEAFFCYRTVERFGGQVAETGTVKLPIDSAVEPVALPQQGGIFSVLGRRTSQKAAFLDLSGHVKADTSLPYFPNLLGPLVPDWFMDLKPVVSLDGKVAAVARMRVAWVFNDTDRDWGSEIVLLNLQPLAVTAKLKAGKGGIRAIAVNQEDGVIRLIGFWEERWHDFRCDSRPPGDCRPR